MSNEKRFRVGNREVGYGAKVFIVAELSANHGGSLDVALRTIDAARAAGADAIKLQTYTPDTLTLACKTEPFIVRTNNEWSGRTLHDLYKEAMTPWIWHEKLRDHALAQGLSWFSTPFCGESARFLYDLNAPAFKIASFELQELSLIETVARLHRPMILSTGMADEADIEAALMACHEAGNKDVALLCCVSAYPASSATMNLERLTMLGRMGVVTGLSDHSRGNTAAVVAVARGAKIIEKHFVLDRSQGGPDAFFSQEPAEFAAMVKDVRTAEEALGFARFGPSAEEQASTRFRRSLYFARDVKKGELLTHEMVRSVRPTGGLPPAQIVKVLGHRAACDASFGEPVTFEHVESRRAPMHVVLRPFGADDSDFLRDLRNEDTVRAMSFHSDLISEEEHRAYLTKVQNGKDRVILIAEDSSGRVGQVTLTQTGDPFAVEVGIIVAEKARGRGLGLEMLAGAEPWAKAMGARLIQARIMIRNFPSIRCFEKAGYWDFVGVGAVVTCKRRIVSYLERPNPSQLAATRDAPPPSTRQRWDEMRAQLSSDESPPKSDRIARTSSGTLPRVDTADINPPRSKKSATGT
jgi:pseudaminic acid synthase